MASLPFKNVLFKKQKLSILYTTTSPQPKSNRLLCLAEMTEIYWHKAFIYLNNKKRGNTTQWFLDKTLDVEFPSSLLGQDWIRCQTQVGISTVFPVGQAKGKFLPINGITISNEFVNRFVKVPNHCLWMFWSKYHCQIVKA